MEPAEQSARSPQRRRVWRWAVLVLVLLFLAGGLTVAFGYRSLENNLESDQEVFDDIIGKRPTMRRFADGQPLNILVLGSDSREGQTYVRGSTPGLSDTTMLLHVARDRSRAYVVSVPRDLMVDRPECRSKDDDEQVIPATGPVMWNAAYTLGGPSCTIAQFERMTGIRVDHFVLLRFESVNEVADALDGVPICVEEEIDDPANQIYLPEGCYDATGNVALSYVRVRFKISDESDIARLRRQQEFMASMYDKAMSVGTLSNPLRTYRFLDEVTQSFVTDPDLASLEKLASLALQLRDTDEIELFSMPFQSYPPDPNRLAPAPEADRLWRQLRNDVPVDEALVEEAVSATG